MRFRGGRRCVVAIDNGTDHIDPSSARVDCWISADRDGYWWELSMRQVEVSRTIVFDDPAIGCHKLRPIGASPLGVGEYVLKWFDRAP